MIAPVIASAGAPTSLSAQELEPRALQNVPVGTTFAIAALGYSRGNVLFDAALPLEDVGANLGSLTLGAIRAIDVFGLSGRAGLLVPFATGNWEGRLVGVDTATSRTGFADPKAILAVNLLGAPALSMSEMRNYRQGTVVGFQFAITAPLGQYDGSRLINLGSHRWSFAPRLGISQAIGNRWVVEGYGAATLYTDDDDFLDGTGLSQDPFWQLVGDVIYVIRRPDIWFAGSIGYGWGGSATAGDAQKESLANVRASGVLRLPLGRRNGLKLVYVSGITTKLGADFDTFQVAYQHAFGGRR